MPVLRLVQRLAQRAPGVVGSPSTFVGVLAAVVVWLVIGPAFDFSGNWLLIPATATSVGAVILVVLLQYTQNRDTRAIQLKLDELIRVNQRASNNLLNLESLSDQELEQLKQAFARLADQHPEARDELEIVTEELDDAKRKLAAIGAGTAPAHAR